MPRTVPVKEAVERTLRLAVTTTRSLITNLGVEIEEDEDWVTDEELEEMVAEDELEGEGVELEEAPPVTVEEEDWLTEDWEEELPAEDELEEIGADAVAMMYPTPLTWPLVESVGMTMFELSFSCLPVEVSVTVKLEEQSPDSMK